MGKKSTAIIFLMVLLMGLQWGCGRKGEPEETTVALVEETTVPETATLAETEPVAQTEEATTEAATEEATTEAVTEAVTEAKNSGQVIVCLDPGHGGEEEGANNQGYLEKNMNLQIALKLKDILEANGVTVIMTRTSDVTVTPAATRVDYAHQNGATYFVSLHNNASWGGATHENGCMAIVTQSTYQAPNATSTNVYQDSRDLAQSILGELNGIGIPITVAVHASENGGLVCKNCTDGGKYPDGSSQDYYGIIRQATEYGIPATIIEHAFVSNASDLATWLSSDEALQALAEADARGILNFMATH